MKNPARFLLLPLILVSAAAPLVRAQWSTPPQAASRDSMLSSDKNLREHLDDMTDGKGGTGGQQAWRITKGKDFAKLPKEYQWETAPTPIDTPFPVYPFELLRTGVAGKVQVYFVLGPDGRVVKTDLDETTPPDFGLAVRAMLDRCRFTPAKYKDGTPGYAYFSMVYEFQPKGRSDAPVGRSGRFILNTLEKSPDNIAALNQLDQPLKPVTRPGPVYPSALRKEQPAGSAEVEFFVDEDGKAQLPRIVSSNAPAFGFAVAQAVAAWRFEPPLRGGKPVVVRVRLPIEFAGKAATGTNK